MTLTRSDREELLQRIENTVQEKFYDPKFNGKNWNEIVANRRQLIVNADSDPAF